MTSQQTGADPAGGSQFVPTDEFNRNTSFAGAFGPPSSGPRFQRAKVWGDRKGNSIEMFRMRWDRFGGGLNITHNADYNSHYDRLSDSQGLDGTYGLQLPIKRTVLAVGTTLDVGGNLIGLHSANFNRLLYFASGSDANEALFKETSATSPIPVGVTFTPDAAITGIWRVVLGSATAAETLAVGTTSTTGGQGVRLLNTSHAVAATMHDDTRRCWGIIGTIANNNAHLIYSGGASGAAAMRLLDATVAATTQPTTYGLVNVPNGGYVPNNGYLKLNGAPLRAAMVIPHADTPAGMLLFGSEVPGSLFTFNFEGNLLQKMPVGIENIFYCDIWREQASFQSDGTTITVYDGKGPARNINWQTDRVRTGDFIYECRGLKVLGDELWIKEQYRSPSAAGATQERWINFDIRKNAVQAKTVWRTLSGTSTYTTMPGSGGFPFSEQNSYLHDYSDAAWSRNYVQPYGQDPYTLFRGDDFDSTAALAADLPEMSVPGYDGVPKDIARVWFGGTLNAGMVTIRPATGYAAASFPRASGLTMRDTDDWFEYRPNGPLVDKVAPRVTLTQGTAVTTPNGVPFAIEGYAYIKGHSTPSMRQWR